MRSSLSLGNLPNNRLSLFVILQENDAKALAEKIAAKKAREEAIARGETVPEAQKGSGGVVKKKDGTKK